MTDSSASCASTSHESECHYESPRSGLKRKRAKLPVVPELVCFWKRRYAELLNIYYDKDFVQSPFDLLEKTGTMENFTVNQKQYIDKVKFYLKFDIKDLFYLGGIRQNKVKLDKILEELAKDAFGHSGKEKAVAELAEPCEISFNYIDSLAISAARDFIYELQHFLNLAEDCKKKGASPELSSCEIIHSFANLCRLKAWKGEDNPSVWEGLVGLKVTSKPDLRLYKLGKSFTHPEPPETVVSVIEVKRQSIPTNVDDDGSTDEPPHKRRRSSKYDADVPALEQELDTCVLGQHAGELLLDLINYGIDKNDDVLMMSGMILNGTKVIFTLLEISKEHARKLSDDIKNKPDLKKLDKEKDKATIYYCKPLDILIEEQRHILIDNFMRFNNLGNCSLHLEATEATQHNRIHLLRILGKLIDNKKYTDDELENLTWQKKSGLIQSDPVTCTRHFDYSLQCFMNHFILTDLNPIGKVTDWVLPNRISTTRVSPCTNDVLVY